MKKNPEGLTVAHVKKEDERDVILHFTKELEDLTKPEIIANESISSALSQIKDELKFELITGRNVISRIESAEEILTKIKEKLARDGRIMLLQAVPSLSSRLSDFVEDASLKEEMLKAEKAIYSSSALTKWKKEDAEKTILSVFPSASIKEKESQDKRVLSLELLSSWWTKSYSKYMKNESAFISELKDKTVSFKSVSLIIKTNEKKKRENISEEKWKEVHEKTK